MHVLQVFRWNTFKCFVFRLHEISADYSHVIIIFCYWTTLFMFRLGIFFSWNIWKVCIFLSLFVPFIFPADAPPKNETSGKNSAGKSRKGAASIKDKGNRSRPESQVLYVCLNYWVCWNTYTRQTKFFLLTNLLN